MERKKVERIVLTPAIVEVASEPPTHTTTTATPLDVILLRDYQRG